MAADKSPKVLERLPLLYPQKVAQPEKERGLGIGFYKCLSITCPLKALHYVVFRKAYLLYINIRHVGVMLTWKEGIT